MTAENPLIHMDCLCARCQSQPSPHTLDDCRAAVAKADADAVKTIDALLHSIAADASRALLVEFARLFGPPRKHGEGAS